MIQPTGIYQSTADKSMSKHPIPAQRTKLRTVSPEDRETLKKFILTMIDIKLREALKKLSINEENILDEVLFDSESNYSSKEVKLVETEDITSKEITKEYIDINGETKPVSNDKGNEKNQRQFQQNGELKPYFSIVAKNGISAEGLKSDNQFECSICYETQHLMNSESFGCSHFFCRKCLCQYLTTLVVSGRTDSLKCPETGCDTEASEIMVEKIVPFKVFQRYYELRIKKAVGKMDDIFYCPNNKCQAIVPCEIDVGLGVCYECGFSFCTNCLAQFHGTIDCYLNEQEKREMILRHLIQEQTENEEIAKNSRITEEQRKAEEMRKNKRLEQDKASEYFIRKAFKRCPGCKSDVEKQEGCNHMICTACLTHFCWLCLTKFANDNERSNHFNSKCLLFKYDFLE